MSQRILLVEDEPGLVFTLTDRLQSEGYEVDHAENGDEGYELALADDFDLIVLDIMLPGRNGFDVCRDLRKEGVETPILMLTARGQVADRVVGLKLGADDYLTKPFETIELLARIEALLRRAGPGGPSRHVERYTFGDVEVDFRKAEVVKDGEQVALSTRELRLLRYFIENRDVVLTRDELLDKVWGYDATPSTRTVDVHIAWLRQKIETNPRHPEFIVTVHGQGYKFVG